MNVVKQLRGGSLSSTCVVQRASGLYVRKTSCRANNREHGLIRLFSQKSKQNHLARIFPQYFLPVLETGLDRLTGDAYVELEYKEGYRNLFEALSENPPEATVAKIFRLVRHVIEELGCHELESRITPQALDLYFEEELIQPVAYLRQANVHPLLEKEHFTFQGHQVRNLAFRDLGSLSGHYQRASFGRETLTHGNFTLENILVSPDLEDIKLIDCYDENYVSSRYNDLSQLLQCTRAFYSASVGCRKLIDSDGVSAAFQVPRGISQFNEMLEAYLAQVLDTEERRLIDLYLISQFTRMLPFKMKGGDSPGALYYFALASSLYESFISR
ncbi:hypothetical protein [Pseudomonas peli]|uniref:hypothetical protein n=1 Tax=Pseudomonas peli TaxID=592361 RepID=UPI0024AD5E5C|nr:hypothetical protein [Pseudomonas peli]